LLEKRRVERLIAIHTEDANALSAEEVINALVKQTAADASDPVGQAVTFEVADRLMALAADDTATPETQNVALNGVLALQHAVGNANPHLANEIERFLRDPKNNTPKVKPSGAPEGPPV
jgi:two-component sensor histidine kinase